MSAEDQTADGKGSDTVESSRALDSHLNTNPPSLWDLEQDLTSAKLPPVTSPLQSCLLNCSQDKNSYFMELWNPLYLPPSVCRECSL